MFYFFFKMSYFTGDKTYINDDDYINIIKSFIHSFNVLCLKIII